MTETPAPSMLKALVATDVLHAIKDYMAAEHWAISARTKKYTAPFVTMKADAPWIYTKTDPEMFCGFYQMTFNQANIIHSRCLECWKICVLPRTVEELFILYALELDIAAKQRWPCKCGIDLRKHTPHRYGGYFYCKGEQMGRKRWLLVRKLVDEYLSKDVPVILKRYCTEFELKLGPTDRYERPEHANELEKMLEEAVDFKTAKSPEQPEFVRKNVQRRWLEFAWSIGDKTAEIFNDGQPFFSPLVTYHDEALKQLREGETNV